MPHKRYFSYIRVSTQRQGQNGTSLIEQQSAIERYAAKWNLNIVRRFEERETAAKQGRPVFLEMLKALKQSRADGVIIHKIDRSARNLKDWADLGTLIDAGLEVHFSSESLDLTSRGGRLSADIQAVVASDYIRNLREETKKGIYGRLKQGLYPFPAVTGYLNCGKGQPKQPDPAQAPLIRRAFELYATGDWGLIALGEELYRSGLRNKNGRRISLNGLSTFLHNPFYTGTIKKRGELYAGIHQPIVSKALYDRVQMVLAGKNIKKQNRHFFVFRRQIRCSLCHNLLIPERKKKIYIYYRCHASSCRRSAIKEEIIDKKILQIFAQMRLTEKEYTFLRQEAAKESRKSLSAAENLRKQIVLQQNGNQERLSKLADAYIDRVFDRKTYLDKKNALVIEEQSLKEKISNFQGGNEAAIKRFDAFLELVNSAYLSYKTAQAEHRRDLVKNITSEFSAEGKNLIIKLQIPFQMVVERPAFTYGSPYRETTRTFAKLAKNLFEYFRKSDNFKNDEVFINYATSKEEKNNKNTLLELNN